MLVASLTMNVSAGCGDVGHSLSSYFKKEKADGRVPLGLIDEIPQIEWLYRGSNRAAERWCGRAGANLSELCGGCADSDYVERRI